MTEEQKESLRFYTTNDYLLINGLLWNEKDDVIDEFIRIINEDGRGVMKEAEEMGFSKRWNCSEEEGARLYEVYKKRFPLITSKEICSEIIARARDDIDNMMAALMPLEEDLVLYRNVRKKYVENLTEGDVVDYKGFSSCSLEPHVPESATYGHSNSVLLKIQVPKVTPAIRLDKFERVGNEPDEIILPPMKLKIANINDDSIDVIAAL